MCTVSDHLSTISVCCAAVIVSESAAYMPARCQALIHAHLSRPVAVLHIRIIGVITDPAAVNSCPQTAFRTDSEVSHALIHIIHVIPPYKDRGSQSAPGTAHDRGFVITGFDFRIRSRCVIKVSLSISLKAQCFRFQGGTAGCQSFSNLQFTFQISFSILISSILQLSCQCIQCFADLVFISCLFEFVSSPALSVIMFTVEPASAAAMKVPPPSTFVGFVLSWA